MQLKASPWGLFSTIKQEFFLFKDISIISYIMISICNATENWSHCLMLGWQWFITNSCSVLCYGVLGQCWDSSSGDVEGNCPADKGENWQHTAVSWGLYGWWGQTLSEGQHWWGKGQLDFCTCIWFLFI